MNAERRPLTFSTVAVLAPVVALKFIHAALAALGVAQVANRLIAEAAFSGYVALLLWRMHWWRDAGFARPTSARRLAAWLPLLLVPLLILAGSGVKTGTAQSVVGLTLLTLMVGFAEEGLMRGVVLRALRSRGAVQAAVISSVIFGAAHLANVVEGAPLSATLLQASVATLLGISFASARLYTGTIWPAIGLHAFIDFADIAGRGFVLPPPQVTTFGRAIVPITLTGLCSVYGWWLLRRR